MVAAPRQLGGGVGAWSGGATDSILLWLANTTGRPFHATSGLHGRCAAQPRGLSPSLSLLHASEHEPAERTSERHREAGRHNQQIKSGTLLRCTFGPYYLHLPAAAAVAAPPPRRFVGPRALPRGSHPMHVPTLDNRFPDFQLLASGTWRFCLFGPSDITLLPIPSSAHLSRPLTS